MNSNIDENVKIEETGLDSLVGYNSKNQFLRNLEKKSEKLSDKSEKPSKKHKTVVYRFLFKI
jgi:hypothetical protein